MMDRESARGALMEVAGLALGIVIGGPLGPIVFGVAGLSDPTAATAGSFFGAVIGYAVVAVLLRVQRHRRDRELQRAAEAVKAEAHLPQTISIRVDDGRLILEGVAENEQDRVRAKEVLETIPGVKVLINRVYVRPTAGGLAAAPQDISRQIKNRLLLAAEEDAQHIQVVLNNSRVVLKGRVRSWAEASTAEEAAWGIPGITDVENRLEITA